MTFEHRDPDGGFLRIRPLPGISAVLIETGPQGCAIDADLMPDVVAGARDTTRTASGQQPERDCPSCEVGIEHTEHCPTPETHNWGCGCPTDEEPRCLRCAPAVDQPDPTTADDPTPLRWGLNDVLWGDDDTVTICLSGPAPERAPYWLELDPEQRDVLRNDLVAPETIEPQDHPAADLYVRLRKAGEDHDTAQALIYAHARMAVRQHTALSDAAPVGRCIASHCVEGDHILDLGPDATRRIGDA